MLETRTEVIVHLQNEPGSMASAIKDFGERKVNIHGFSMQDEGKQATLHMICDKPEEALQCATDAGFKVASRPVVCTSVENEPGAVSKITKKLSSKEINLETCYLCLDPELEGTALILGVDDVDAAKECLKETVKTSA